MVIDTSAAVAILFDEPDALPLARAIEHAQLRRISAATVLETAIVVERRYGPNGGEKLDKFLAQAAIRIEPVTPEQAAIDRRASRAFGKGRHPAALNFGDCFAYALAVSVGEPLLYKGNDFGLTDVEKAATE
jgi:ribonuclease VapC